MIEYIISKRGYFYKVVVKNEKKRITKEDYTKKISPELVTKYCLAPGEIIPVCFK